MLGRDREVYEEHEENSEFACYSMHIAGIKAKERAESEARGELKKAYAIAQNGLKKGLPIPLISELTGLCEEEIEKITTS
jgi:hypothetical protein